jgi:hypothetical protein
MKRAAGELARLHVVAKIKSNREKVTLNQCIFYISVGSENRLNFGMSADV